MSKHWRPEGKIARIRPVGDPRKWLGPEAYEAFRPAGRPLPQGAKAGLVLVAAACVGVAFGLYAAFGPRNAIAPEARSHAVEDPIP